jgi:putative phage-type endonuclease
MVIHNVEQRSQEWHELRRAKVTGTKFKSLLAKNPIELVYELIAEAATVIEDDEDGYVSDAMLWGAEMEPLACLAYEGITGRKVQHAGFISRDDADWFGLSPDGFVELEDGSIIGIEIKAPNTKRHVKTIVENKVPTDSKANWRPQCMMWFLLDKRVKQVDFICYDERYTDKKCHIISIFREDVEDEIIEMQNKVEAFYHNWQGTIHRAK